MYQKAVDSEEFNRMKTGAETLARSAAEKGKRATRGVTHARFTLKAKDVWEAARKQVRGESPGEGPGVAMQLKELMAIGKEDASALSDGAAQKIADIYLKATGKETTPEQVKKVALRIGVAAVVTLVIALVLGQVQAPGEGGWDFAGGGEAGGAEGLGGGGGVEGFDNSFEGQASSFFADKGGLNISTDVVDMDGCVLDMG